VDAAFNLRLSTVHYSQFNANGRSQAYLQDHGLVDASGNGIDGSSYTFAEPSFTVRGGYKFAKVQLQVVFAQSLTDVPWNYNGVRFTAGFYLGLEDALAPGKKHEE
jgi:hypothetical protein